MKKVSKKKNGGTTTKFVNEDWIVGMQRDTEHGDSIDSSDGNSEAEEDEKDSEHD